MSEHQETGDQTAARLQRVTDQLSAAIGAVECSEQEMGDVLVSATLQTLVKTMGQRDASRRLYLLAINLFAEVEMTESATATAEALRRAGAKMN